jgi:putative transposase
MANSYSQISLQFIVAVKHREALILPSFRDELFKYIFGIIENKNQKSLAVNGVEDHVHIFVGLKPTVYIPDFIRDLKSDSSEFVNKKKLARKWFHWQEGYAVFSYSTWQRDMIIKYILNQEEHHRKKSFRSEYLSMLDKMGITYDQRYLFDFFDE